jgi:hypothetical protein
VGAVAASAAAANGASDKPTVFLAEPTDDLLVPCHELRSDLEQLGINVIPGFDVFYPREPDAFRAAVRADLAKASAFAQLLSGVAGRTPPGLPEGYVAAQHALAQEMGRQRSLPILQWRSPELTPATVAAPGHRKLLEGTTVIAAGLEEFKRLVAEEAAKAAQPPEEDDAVTVFCSADSVDLQGEHRQRIIEQLNRRNIVSFWLGDSKNPVSEYKKRLKESHAFLVLFGKSELMWVQDQLRHSYKYLPRDKPVGVIEGPPPPEKPADLGIVLPRVTVDVIDCRGGWNEAAFQSFLQKLPARARR